MSSRRRLRLISSSSEEEEEEDLQELQHITLNPPTSIQIDISDEEFIDATDNLSNSPSIPQQNATSSEHSTTTTTSNGDGGGGGMHPVSESSVSRVLEDLGLRLRGEWLDSCLAGLQSVIPGFSSLDDMKKAKLCFERFLNSDMNYCGAGLLPSNVDRMHLVDLPGPFVLQVDEIVNISQPLRERYKKANSGLKRCLKLSMTDGVQRVFGMEYRPIKDLDALAPAGLKVAISNVSVSHGLLMLVPEVFQVLGGVVEELEAARQRLVTEVNKPPRGRRTRSGDVPSLATRATRAAWPANNNLTSPPLNNPVSESTTPMQVDNQAPVNVRESSDSAVRVNYRPSSNFTAPVNGSVLSNSAVPVNARVSSNSTVPDRGEHVGHQPPRTEVESSVSTNRMNIDSFPSTPTTENSVNMNMENASFTVPIVRETVETTTPFIVREETIETTPVRVRQETTVPVDLTSPVAVSDAKNVNLAARSSENPFTYLANLSVKWAGSKDKASHVEGKIKCFVTGVKEFLFKQRNTYKLQVYVDDGSLISEILIDHNIVQKKVGYSPEEVDAALLSPDQSRARGMKNIMKQFQVFLANFEGIMVVRINEASSLPVAVEMQQGCSLSDAWSLLERVKSTDNNRRSRSDPIILSP